MARALPVILLALAISGCFAGEPGDKLFGVHDLSESHTVAGRA